MRMQERTQRKKPGTPGKGPRRAITVRVPPDLWDAVAASAREAGYSNNSDYLNALLAQVHDVAVPAYAQLAQRDEPHKPSRPRRSPDLLRAG